MTRSMGRLEALVTDAHLRWAVAGLRGLGRAGVRSGALAPSRRAAGLWSRWAAQRMVGPDGYVDADGFAREVATVAAAHGPLVVYPAQDETLDALLAARERLPAEAILPYPGAEALARLRDKRALPAMAEAAGLTVPRTLIEGTVAEVRAAGLPLPCIVKPPRPDSALESPRVVATRADLERELDALPDDEPLLVQELAALPLVGLALVLDRDGAVAASFQQVTRRQWPVPVGGSTLAVGVAPDPELVSRSARLLAGAGFWGLAHLQFLGTPRGPALIDVNTRFYGSLPLALASGANLPLVWHAIATGAPVPRDEGYRTGVHYRWLSAELSAAMNGYPHRLLRPTPRPRVGAIWDAHDPLPGILAGVQVGGPMLLRRLPGRR